MTKAASLSEAIAKRLEADRPPPRARPLTAFEAAFARAKAAAQPDNPPNDPKDAA